MVFTIKGLLNWGTRQKLETLSHSEQSIDDIQVESWTKVEGKRVTQTDIVTQVTIDMIRKRY